MIAPNRRVEDDAARDLVLSIAKALVDQGDEVAVDLSVEDTAVTFKLRVAPSDVGKIIGKQGRTARSIRALLSGAGMKLHRRYSLDIQEERPLDGSS
jgi:predicted RNA-binding protein YlqC (UPF0109 family)